MNLDWQLVPFAELSAYQCWSVLKLRQEIFVLEQQCLFPEIDDVDLCSIHLMGWVADNDASGEKKESAKAKNLVAYLRIVPPNQKFTQASLSRIVVAATARHQALGSRLVEDGIRHCKRQHSDAGIQIAAQEHLKSFYAALGFEVSSDRYLEDDIWHVNMILQEG